MGRRHAIVRIVSAATLAVALEGCAAIPLAVVAGSLLEAGGGVLVRTGTEYTASGVVVRTFSVPIDQVHAAVSEALTNMQVTIVRDENRKSGRRIKAVARHRKIWVEIVPLTPALTALDVIVKRNLLASDKATASEILAQTELIVAAQLLAAGPTPAPSPAVPAPAHRKRGR